MGTKRGSEERMYLSAPTSDELRPSPEEQALLGNLIRWQDNSARASYPVGHIDYDW